VWVSVRGVKKEFDEAKLRFAAAEVCEPTCRICIVYIYIYITQEP
jgi:hypothetical protein